MDAMRLIAHHVHGNPHHQHDDEGEQTKYQDGTIFGTLENGNAPPQGR